MIALLPIVFLAVACSAPPEPEAEAPATGTIERLDPDLDALVPADAQIEKVAEGFTFIEGPLAHQDGSVWFSDVVGNVVREWAPAGTVAELLDDLIVANG